MQAFMEEFFWFDLYLYLMVWLEIAHLRTVEPYPHSGLLFIVPVDSGAQQFQECHDLTGAIAQKPHSGGPSLP